MISIILPASKIPDGETVYKVTGEKPYAIRREIKVFGDEDKRKFTSTEGTAFLVDQSGSIQVVPADMKLRLDLPPEEAIELLEIIYGNKR